MKLSYCLFIITLNTFSAASAQGVESLAFHTQVRADKFNTNSVTLLLRESEVNGLHNMKGKDISFKVTHAIVNKDTLKVKHAHIRGQSSSYFRRKSYNVKTGKKATFYTSSDTFRVHKFYAISMSMDANYVRNKISFDIMRLIGVHAPLNAYSTLNLNTSSEGLYLVFYPPVDYAMKKCHSGFVIRRGSKEAIDKASQDDHVNRDEARELEKKFRSLYAPATLRKHGEDLYNQLSSVLDIDSYFKWLAFNHLFQNGDYADEVYFIWNSTASKFEIMPWDFDDLLKEAPHEGIAVREKFMSEKFLFSLEDELDKTIANDPYVYNKYLKVYAAFLNTLTTEKLRDVLKQVHDQLLPYYSQFDVISQSQYDRFGQTSLVKMEADLNSIYNYISVRRLAMSKEVSANLP